MLAPLAFSGADALRGEAPPGRGGAGDAVLFGPYGLRAGWRILLYIALVYLLGTVLGRARAAAGIPPGMGVERTVTLVAAVIAGWLMLAGFDRRRPGALGFALGRFAVREVAIGTGVGGAIVGAAVLLLALTGTVRWVADAGSAADYTAALAGGLLFYFVAAAAEEALFRGYPFQVLVQGVGVWPATLGSSALFALAHLANPNADGLAVANIFVAGVLLAVAYLRTRSLWFATAVHLGWNWTLAALFDLPVSGLDPETPLYTGVETGADWWTGGAFGPEAGLAATLALGVGTAWLLRTRVVGEPDAVRELRPLVDARLGEEWR